MNFMTGSQLVSPNLVVHSQKMIVGPQPKKEIKEGLHGVFRRSTAAMPYDTFQTNMYEASVDAQCILPSCRIIR
jgi:hypothetical protein